MRSLSRLAALLLALVVAAPALADSPDEQLAAASALYGVKKYADAAQKLELFLTENPQHSQAGPAALTLGHCYRELKQFAKAVPAYEKAVATKNPTVEPVALLGLSESAVQSGQWDKASTALEAALKTPLKPDQAAILWFWRGEASFQLKRYPAAEEAYLKVTEEFKNADFVDGAYFGAGLAALRQDRKEDARKRFRTLIDKYPKSEDRPRAMLLVAQMDLEADRFKEARAGYEALLKETGGKPESAELEKSAEEGLVSALLELQDYAAATNHLESLLQRLPKSDAGRPRAQLYLGHCRYRQKQYEPALAAYQEAAASKDETIAVEGRYWAASALVAAGRPADGALQFAKLVEAYPKHDLAPKAQLQAGDALAATKQTAGAVTAYQKLIQSYPGSKEAGEARKALGDLTAQATDPAALAELLKNAPPAERARGTVRLARLYLEAKKAPQAEAALNGILKQASDPAVAAEAHYLLGLALDVQEKPAPAAAALDEAVRLGPSAPWALDAQSRLASLYLDLKKPADAEKAATAVLGLKPDAAAEQQARLVLLQASLDQQKWDAALQSCRALLDGKPSAQTAAMLVYTQAWVYEKQEKPAEALPLWEQLVEKHRRSEYAAEALLRVGDARFKAEKHDDARAKYAEVLAEFPKSPLATEARFKLGIALYNQQKLAEAVAEWDAVTGTTGDWAPEALYWSGVALDKLDKKAEALDRLEKLVAQYPKSPRIANARVRVAALKAVLGK